ncbi:MAG: putative rane protein [Deltaproteobacteria bacterium]|nr:putative rane protein [Deltaproteobacteria bacterium]
MIIQCRQCRTKFRFDDLNMEGDGLWMRCSRCHHVFFQENPLMSQPAATVPPVLPVFTKEVEREKTPIFTKEVEPEKTSILTKEVEPEKTSSRLVFEPADVPADEKIPDEDATEVIHDHDEASAETPEREEVTTEPETTDQADIELADITFSRGTEELDDTGEIMDTPEEQPLPPIRKKSRRWKAVLWTILVVFVIPAIISFVIFPKLGERYIKLGEHGAKQILNLFGGSKPSDGQYVAGFVKVQDFRQRFLHNDTLGRRIRIVEGTVLNQSDFSIARIMVKVELLDSDSDVLNERVSYAGNVLTDQELSTLSEEEMMKRLSMPEGRNNLNEKVIPDGQIPFMVVFTKDPPGTFKTSVIVSGAERLL